MFYLWFIVFEAHQLIQLVDLITFPYRNMLFALMIKIDKQTNQSINRFSCISTKGDSQTNFLLNFGMEMMELSLKILSILRCSTKYTAWFCFFKMDLFREFCRSIAKVTS